MQFTYVALDYSGQRLKGSLKAKSIQDARTQLLEHNACIVKIKKSYVRQRELGPRLTLRWTEGLEQLIDSGLSLRDALLLLIQESKGREKHLSEELVGHIECGETFSSALKMGPYTFDEFYITMMEAGEKTGQLAENLRRVKEVLAQKASLKKKFTSALIYPGFLLSFCFLALTFILVQVIPSIEELIVLEKAPFITRFVLNLSSGIRAHFEVLFAGILGLAIAAVLLRKPISRCLIRLPFIRSLQMLSDLQQVSHLSAALLKADVGLFDTLHLAGKLVKTRNYKLALEEAQNNLLQGVLLSETLGKGKRRLFPALFIQRLAIGEKSADLKVAFERLAKLYDDKLSSIYAKISTLLQPVLILLLAGLVGGVMLAVLIPLTDFGSLDL